MSELGGLDAGPLYVDVVADVTGFSRGLQEKINAEVSRVKATVTAEIDSRKAEAQLAALARKEYVAQIRADAQITDAQTALDRAAAKQRVAQIKAEAQIASAQADLDRVASTERVAQIKAEAQIISAQADLDRAAAKGRIAQIKAEAQTIAAEGELDRAAAKERVAEIKLQAETVAAEAKLLEAEHKKRTAEIKAEATDVEKAKLEIDDAAQDRTAHIKIEVDGSEISKAGSVISSIGTGAFGLLQMPAIAGGISMAVQAVMQLAGGLAAVAAAAAPAVGLLGAIPGLVAGAAQGLGTVVTGFGGIADAMKASTAASKASGATAGATAAQHAAAAARISAAQDQLKQAVAAEANAEANAARAVQQAQEGVANAHREAARAVVAAQQSLAQAQTETARQIQAAQQGLAQAETETARQIQAAEQAVATAHQQAAQAVAQAEQQLATAQRDATQAQLDLVAARQSATRQLQDMNNQLTDQNFTVRQAQLDVQTAGVSRTKIYQSPTSSDTQRKQADLSYEEAVQRLKEEQLQQQRLAADAAKANKAGVEGSALVTTAKQRLIDANEKVRQSEIAITTARTQGAAQVAKAEQSLQDARTQGAARIAKAEQSLQDARITGAQRIAKAEQSLQDARITGAQKVADAESNLANTRRTSAFSVESAQHAVLDAQRNLTAAQAAGATATGQQSAATKNLQAAMSGLAPAGRDFVKFLVGTLIPAWQDVQKTVQQALLPPVQRGLTALMPLLGILQSGMVQTATILGGAFERLATQYLATPLFKRDLAAIMASNNRSFTILATALTPLARGLVDVTVASQPLLRRFAEFIATSAILVSNFIHAQRESGNLGRFFKLAGDTAGELWRIVRDLAIAIFNIGKAAYPAGKSLLDSFAGVVAKFREWTASLSGRNQLKDYFEQSRSTLEAVGRLVRDIIIDLFQIGRGGSMAGLIDEIRTRVLPPIKDLIGTLNKGFGPALVRGIGDVAKLLGDLSKGGGGALTAYVNTLDAMVRALDALVSIPGVGKIIGSLLSMAASFAAISLIAGPLVSGIGGVVKAMGGLAIELGVADAEATAGAGAMELLGAAMDIALGPVGLVIAAVAALAGGFYLAYTHSTTFRNLVNTALRDVGSAAIWLWHNAITPAFDGIMVGIRAVGTAASWLWTHAIRPAFTAIGDYVSWWWVNAIRPIFTAYINFIRQVIFPAMSWLYRDVMKPIFTAIGTVVKWWWNNIVKPEFTAFIWMLQHVVAPVIQWLWRNVVVPYFNNMGNAIKVAVAIITGILNALNKYLRNTVGPTIAWLFNNVVKPYFTQIGSIISTTWSRVISPAFNAIKTGLSRVADAFRSGVNDIKAFWSLLTAAVRAPVKFVIDTVYNQGIRGFWNAVASKVGLPIIKDPLRVKGINAARGAVVPGYAPGVDIVNATLSPGEGVLVPEAVRGLSRRLGMSAEHAIQLINSSFSTRVNAPPGAATSRKLRSGIPGGPHPGFDLGGVFGSIGDGISWVGHQIGAGASAAASYVKDKVGGVLGDLVHAVRGLLSGPLHAAAIPLHALINRVLPAAPELMNLLRTGANHLVDGGIDFLTGKDQAQAAAASGGGGGSVTGTRVPNVGSGVERWRSLVVRALAAQGLSTGLADRVLRQMQTESGGNPNAVQGNIGDINNRTGDLAKGFMQVIGATFRAYHWPGTSNNIFDPWANLMAALNYAKHRYGSSLSFLGQGHGYSLGGLVKRAMSSPVVSGLAEKAGRLFDSGGVLNPGTTLVHNATGKPEVVLNPLQWDTLARLASAGASAVYHEPTASERSSGAQVDIHVHPTPGMDVQEIARRVAVEVAWQMRGA